MANILFVVPYAKYYLNFNGDLLESLVRDGHHVTALAPDLAAQSSLSAMGVKFVQVPIRNTGINPIYDLFTIRHLARIIRDEQPDVVSCYSIKPVLYGSLAARMSNQNRVYVHITGLGYMFTERSWKQRLLMPVVKMLYGFAFRYCAGAFFENKDDLHLFVKMGLVEQDKATILNGLGVNLQKFTKPPGKAAHGPPSFILVARIIKDKGIYEFVEAARILRKKYPDTPFYLLGPFDLNPASIDQAQVQQWDDEGVIKYLGETDDVRPYLSSTDVFVLPSFYREGTPKSILEAMSMGMPVVTTDAPGCRDTVIHGKNGFLVPVKDAGALANAMERFMLNPGLVDEMGACSRAMAEQTYDVHQVNAKIRRTMQVE